MRRSTIERLIGRTGLPWYGFVAVLALVLVLGAISAAYLDGVLDGFFSTNLWRGLLFFPAIITYMLAILPPLGQANDGAIGAFRTLAPMDDDEFDHLVDEAATADPRKEGIAFGVGIAIGLLVYLPGIMAEGLSWLVVYLIPTVGLVGGLFVWSIYSALAGARAMAALHQLPLQVNIFDQRPLGPIGRQSLASALAFFGGAAVSLLFFAWGEDSFGVGTLFTYGLLVLVSALAFFLPMRQTHRVLAAAKEEELVRVQHNIVAAYRSLEELPAESKDLGTLPTKLNLWKEYEGRVKAIRTWPYDFGMLRTFLLSVLTPVVLSLVQRLIAALFNL